MQKSSWRTKHNESFLKNRRITELFLCRTQQSLGQRGKTGFYLGFLSFGLALIPLTLKFLSMGFSECSLWVQIFARWATQEVGTPVKADCVHGVLDSLRASLCCPSIRHRKPRLLSGLGFVWVTGRCLCFCTCSKRSPHGKRLYDSLKSQHPTSYVLKPRK